MSITNGYRVLPATKKRIEYLAGLSAKSKSAVVNEKVDGAPMPPPKEDSRRVSVSYNLDEAVAKHLQAMSQVTGRSQGEVLDYLFGQN
jgi:hypothetical protein